MHSAEVRVRGDGFPGGGGRLRDEGLPQHRHHPNGDEGPCPTQVGPHLLPLRGRAHQQLIASGE